MEIRILPQVARELADVPKNLNENIFGVLQRLEKGENIPMPLCRPLFGIEKGLYELRFSHQSGEWRVFYFIKVMDAIYVLHAMKKKTQKMDRRVLNLLRSRIRSL
ncbi:MAG: type II toxin-antitoxin system RelE/ParE family toxin [Deltaproteobacteria bacterium]|nr:type II toxin-antitoxin system RelE/ParE family toxin [Deltaproteobacteria bacterium]